MVGETVGVVLWRLMGAPVGTNVGELVDSKPNVEINGSWSEYL
jgi:hypothetical protein